MTNKHVVKDAESIRVVLNRGDIYDRVEILKIDPLNDLAFLRVRDVNDFPVATLGDSTTIKVGQRAIAIGNSLGHYKNTVTSGIISGKGRPLTAKSRNSVERLKDLIQTDAAINPGNSGGPLLNASGQVIGINTAIVKNAEDMGFAIPINASKGILKQVLDGKMPKRAFLGVKYLPISAALANKYKLPLKKGALVQAEKGSPVAPGSPAYKVGLRTGDIITKINDIEVGERGGVSSLIAEYAPGDTIEMTIRRNGKTEVFKVTLDAYDD